MFGEGGDPLWAAAVPVDPGMPGRFPPSLPAPYPGHLRGIAPPAAPAPYPEHPRCFVPPRGRAVWTDEENRAFEAALVEFHWASEEERCREIAARLPGKTWEDVREHYQRLERDLRDIEAGVIGLPEYADDWCDPGAGAGAGSSGGGAGRAKPEERKKGIPWTEEEHRRFLEGLEKYGKGDWRSISRMAVVTRTPTQVASHAQKYFLRQSTEGKKDRRRSSIHDVTRT
ncbi:hypothetical protein Taro_031040 [Colocasia esculenta]|uniref:Uncharacterized protein n=1 Tax=Colocasia esculenta TaxID=4460 RepID=A0A843W564_COLES|nr:hypothetical protein [Colocasia esculenta]